MKASVEAEVQTFETLVNTFLKHRNKGSNCLANKSFEEACREYLPKPAPHRFSNLTFDTSLISPKLSTDNHQEIMGIFHFVSAQLSVAREGYTLLSRDWEEKHSTRRAFFQQLDQEGLTPEKLNQIGLLQKTLHTDLLALPRPELIPFSSLVECLKKYARARDLLEKIPDQTPTYNHLMRLFALYGYTPAQESLV